MKYLIIILFILFPVMLSAQTLINKNIIAQIETGETALLNARWEQANRTYDSLRQENQTSPVGYLYLAGVLQSKMIAFEENLESDRFFSLLDSTIILSKKILADCTERDSALCYLLLGHQNAYRAMWESRFGSNLSAISYGFKARNRYDKGVEIDPTLNDLYFGLGSYHYWKTVRAGILTWTGILKNDRKKGISEINRAIDSSLFSKNAARSAMIWVYINEKEYEKAITLAGEMHEKYPDGNFFLWPQAESYYKLKKYPEAIEIYNTILNRIKAEPGNYFNIIEAVYHLYQSYIKSNDKENADRMLLYFDSIKDNFPKQTRRKQHRKILFLDRRL